ncbi:3-phosphoserine/phosphohydroxythreonine transaminase [Enterobacteriaceae endosymbiont of Neohaemonia nigricornis]|uniref:3-phosphoserine/phosphohydroxythreonine transaminase n=1 Tax=Enterobacteriaceae endosymbiont of Neohaemonia nigricornis TaxID=2675792 RepID=UPI001448FDAC|nr:3-phosphoserine/phosphohydroxythreonine transaminase [Enterobacteriaceae endosymbiont of Neohaemonia nigricornis]QJC30482.1 3-phosphoserine/phosphohydroxythreonine transaminase [Enterobacteriaceae endosymbiont of Neohaemonia nigricornis]
MNQIFNFSPGPAILPHTVLKQAQKELLNWNNLNMSVMEISHRSKYFIRLIEDLKEDLITLMNIPNNYEILFCQGGARSQFSAVPMNLLKYNDKAAYVNMGFWSNKAIQEAKKYCNPYVLNVKKKKNNIDYIQLMNKWHIHNDIKYIHYCPNETIEGIATYEEPSFNDIIVVADLSSYILTKYINIKQYGVIYASAQKNIGPAGLTIVIIRKDLLEQEKRIELPSALNYQIIAQHNSMFNTPPTFALYLSYLVLQWLKQQGGISTISHINQQKSQLLYDTIDNSNIYINNIAKKNRSMTNIVFTLPNIKTEKLFLKYANNHGLFFLKGHNAIGGIRASIYNAMPLKGVKKLVNCMNDFEKKYL